MFNSKDGRVKLGKLLYEEIDDVGMNKQKEKFIEYCDVYKTAGLNIATSLEILKIIKKEENLIILSKYSPAFIQMVWQNFISQSVTQLYSFYHNTDDLSFHNFFNYIRGNYDKIFTKTVRVTRIEGGHKLAPVDQKATKKDIFETLEFCEKCIEEKRDDIIHQLKVLRENLYAHFAKDRKNAVKDVILQLDDLDKILKFTQDVYNKIKVLYDGHVDVFQPVNAKDVMAIINILRAYDENRKEFDIIIKNKMLKEMEGKDEK